MPTTGRSKTATCVLEHSVGATHRIEREFLDVLDWDLSVTETDIVKHYHHISAFSSEPETVPVAALPPALDDVEMDAYPWEISEDSPLSSYSLPADSCSCSLTVQPTYSRSFTLERKVTDLRDCQTSV